MHELKNGGGGTVTSSGMSTTSTVSTAPESWVGSTPTHARALQPAPTDQTLLPDSPVITFSSYIPSADYM